MEILYDTFDILQKMGVDVPGKTGNIRMTCPFCQRKKKFSINRGGDYHGIYNCFDCGEHGGAFQLYVKLTNSNLCPDNESDQKEIHVKIKELLNIDDNISWTPKVVPKVLKTETVAPVEKRDAVYRFMLSLCVLSKAHNESLLNRGFNEETIKKNLYRSVPNNMSLIVSQLVTKGYQLKGVPGFYKDQGRWQIKWMPSGVFIAVVNEKGQIEALNVRVDKPIDGNKYLYYSSEENKSSDDKGSGTKAVSTYHIRGEHHLNGKILVVEGLYKTDLAYQYMNIPMVGILGSGTIVPLLEFIDRYQIKDVTIAMDMDYMINKFVHKNVMKLMAELEGRKIDHTILIWDAKYKGIDDYLTRVQ